jgi:ubiquinone/menaquinone biosynthesis C-methylase UbiE
MVESNKIKEYWEKEKTVSLKDENLRELETTAIANCIRAIDKSGLYICDMGCGDGTNTIKYSRLNNVKQVVGIDYSSAMIEKAKKNIKRENIANITFVNGNVSELCNFTNKFDAVITQRCLINLPVLDEQIKAIEIIRKSLKKGGYFIMLEATRDGLERLNRLRTGLSLDSLNMPWHNNYFDIKVVEGVLKRNFSVLKKQDFAIYYLYTRILNQMLGLDVNSESSKKIDIAAAKIQRQYEETFLGIGAQTLFFLRRK